MKIKKSNQDIKILIAAAEVTPIAKVGGLGDVIGALPKALKKLGADVRVIIPFYGSIDRSGGEFELEKSSIAAATAMAEESVNLYKTFLPDSQVPVYLVEHDFFRGKNIYGDCPPDIRGLYPNGLAEIEKFVFFSRALLAAAEAIGFKPDILHLNDWHTAAAALFLKNPRWRDGFFKGTAALYTIHNLANQGIADTKVIALNKINPGLPQVFEDQKDDNINFMAQGILNAAAVTTVSPTYAREILTAEYGAGLEKVLALKKKQLTGILNGLDTDFFNPRTDRLIAGNYPPAVARHKADNKLILQKKFGLPINKKIALAGVVTRFVGQKGLELINEKFAELACQFVFLGTGEQRQEQALLRLAEKFPAKFSVRIKFDEKLAHEIYAGSDIFLAPSRFEPCGLTQLIAMRYGSVPIVRATGGLKDTVANLDASLLIKGARGIALAPLPKGGRGVKPTGFVFKNFSSDEFYKTLAKALSIYYEKPKVWRQLQINGMRRDFSWKKSAKEYLKLYKKLLSKK